MSERPHFHDKVIPANHFTLDKLNIIVVFLDRPGSVVASSSNGSALDFGSLYWAFVRTMWVRITPDTMFYFLLF